ncbi:MAG: NRDE family protein [Bacteroidetes bacterium]|nr:NRDE family protein [Bacteroidota bacterium]
MCLVFFSFNQYSDYPLIIAANRDEYYLRKTAPLQHWPDHPQIIGGFDVEQYSVGEIPGTWFGVTLDGRVALITNYRDVSKFKPNAPSRGKLVSGFLGQSIEAKLYTNQLKLESSKYNGFNLVFGNTRELFYYSNQRPDTEILNSGSYGLSNGLLNDPWPKVKIGKERFDNILHRSAKNGLSEEDLFEMLSDRRTAALEDLPRTGLSPEREKALSASFISTHDYGTRSSAILSVKASGEVTFTERTFLPNQPPQTKTIRFNTSK